jgi:hypothetical protein
MNKRERLNWQKATNLKSIEKAKRALEKAQDELEQAYIGLGRTLMQLDVLDLQEGK